MPVSVPGVDDGILDPRSTWTDGNAYDAQARRLVDMFIANFAKFEDHVDGSVRDAAPGAKIAAE
ncbi:Phosphoenolpyruvate carboxykinase [ATP] [compost metagenome]